MIFSTKGKEGVTEKKMRKKKKKKKPPLLLYVFFHASEGQIIAFTKELFLFRSPNPRSFLLPTSFSISCKKIHLQMSTDAAGYDQMVKEE